MWRVLLLGLFLFLLWRFWSCLPSSSTPPRQVSPSPLSCLIVFGSGGHTTEMLRIIARIRNERYSPIYFLLAHSDKTSLGKIQSSKIPYLDSVKWKTIYRSREVKQSWSSTVLTTLYAFAQSLWLVISIRPQIIICNGPGTCVPICLAAYLLRVLALSDSVYRPHIVFAESYCRVQSLSLTGKILYPIADRFIVQWETLLTQRYPRAQFIGKIC